MTKRDAISNRLIIETLIGRSGNITQTAKDLDVDRRTLYYWIEADNELKEAVEDIPEILLDRAESKLQKHIDVYEDITCLIFFLKTKGRKRGYSERDAEPPRKSNRTVVSADEHGNYTISHEFDAE